MGAKYDFNTIRQTPANFKPLGWMMNNQLWETNCYASSSSYITLDKTGMWWSASANPEGSPAEGSAYHFWVDGTCKNSNTGLGNFWPSEGDNDWRGCGDMVRCYAE